MAHRTVVQAANSSQHTSLPSAAMSPESVRFELPQDAVLVECGSHLFLDVVVDGAKAADQELGNNHQRERPGLKAYMEGLAAVFPVQGLLVCEEAKDGWIKIVPARPVDVAEVRGDGAVGTWTTSEPKA